MGKFYKTIRNGYVIAIGTGIGATEITEAEYNAVMDAIRNRPEGNYRLKEDLSWEEYEPDIVVPDPNDNSTLESDEAVLVMTEKEAVTQAEAETFHDIIFNHA